MKREQRLTRSTDIKRVRLQGKAYAHPLIVLKALSNDSTQLHIGVTVGKAVGNAVTRNKTKRRLKACLQALAPILVPGWDLVIIARTPISSATYAEIEYGVFNVLKRAQLLGNREVLNDDRIRISQ